MVCALAEWARPGLGMVLFQLQLNNQWAGKAPAKETRNVIQVCRHCSRSPGFDLKDLPQLTKAHGKLSWGTALAILCCFVMIMWKTPGASHLERKLVHRVDPAQVVHDEVEQRGAGSHRSIVLPGLIDFHFSHLGLLDLLEKEMVAHYSSQPGFPEKQLVWVTVSVCGLRQIVIRRVAEGRKAALVFFNGASSNHLSGGECQPFWLGNVGHANLAHHFLNIRLI